MLDVVWFKELEWVCEFHKKHLNYWKLVSFVHSYWGKRMEFALLNSSMFIYIIGIRFGSGLVTE